MLEMYKTACNNDIKTMITTAIEIVSLAAVVGGGLILIALTILILA
jgi:hypothetical protein